MNATFLAATELLPEIRSQLPSGCAIDSLEPVNTHTTRVHVSGAPVAGECEPLLTRDGERTWWAWDADHVQECQTPARDTLIVTRREVSA